MLELDPLGQLEFGGANDDPPLGNMAAFGLIAGSEFVAGQSGIASSGELGPRPVFGADEFDGLLGDPFGVEPPKDCGGFGTFHNCPLVCSLSGTC